MRPNPAREAGLLALRAQERRRRIAYATDGVARPFEERARLMAEYKVELKKEYRRRARELHPDMNQGLPEAEARAKGHELAALTEAVDFLMRLEPRPPTPARARAVVDILDLGHDMEELDRLMRQRAIRGRVVNWVTSASPTGTGFPW